MQTVELPELAPVWQRLPRLPQQELHSQRLSLTGWREEDLAPFAELNGDAHALRFFPHTLTREESDQMTFRIHTRMQEFGWGLWALRVGPERRFAGFVGLLIPRPELPLPPALEIGWRLRQDCWGQGYAREAAKLARDFAFHQLGEQDLISITSLHNQPSWRVMQAIGMQDSGQRFDHPAYEEGDARAQHCVYTLNRAAWLAQREAQA
ncbi:GNAT family N-acetyltransferase [Massilia sp. W12]|uniref:GNAT family N-acetyltransferase n=1 Tax=Massilia sp. W12 TaxID=3126507 RepID=UPI0030CCF5AE